VIDGHFLSTALTLHVTSIFLDSTIFRTSPYFICNKTIINPMMHSCSGCQMSWMPRACQPEGFFCRLK
jgi:hypothetical protein